MTWDELLAEFRALGGVADNVRLGEGVYGRGVFPVDPTRPVKVTVPASLMLPVEFSELRDGTLVSKPGTFGERESRFFDSYQRWFGWSTGAYEESLATQQAWHDLPPDVIHFLKTMGVLDDPERRFLAPTEESVLADYVNSRAFFFEGRQRFIPVVDLINHRSAARGYIVGDGVSVQGHFTEEVVVRYNMFDAIRVALTFSFPDRAIFANSIGLTVDLKEHRTLTIARAVSENEPRDNLLFPRVEVRGNHLGLAYLTLGNMATPDAPRAVFRQLMMPYLSEADADQIFDGIAHFNKTRFIELLRVVRKHEDRISNMLEEAAINQLEALAACIGARKPSTEAPRAVG